MANNAKKIAITKTGKWGAAYFLVVICFSFLYWIAWEVSSDNFIVNNQLNLRPIHNASQTFWFEEKDVESIHPIESLQIIQNEYLSFAREMDEANSRMESIELDRKSLSRKRDAIQVKHSELWSVNTKEYEKEKLESLLKEERKLLTEIEIMESILPRISDATDSSQHAVRISNKKVALADLRVKIAKKQYEVASYILSNISEFADPNTLSAIRDLNIKEEVLINAQMKEQDVVRSARSKMYDALEKWRNDRSVALGFVDFFYYSIGISTTTTFGEIIANGKWIRAFVSLQLILSVIVVGGFVNSAISISLTRASSRQSR